MESKSKPTKIQSTKTQIYITPQITLCPVTNVLHEMYLESLSPKELKAYAIAKQHLGLSFTLEKSVGYLNWKLKHTHT
jgi:hypothetical protein